MDINNYQLNFSSLGWFRKLFLIVHWLSVAVIVLGAGVWIFVPEIMNQELGFSPFVLYAMVFFSLAYAFWIQRAISKRSRGQLLALTGIQLFPFFNPITALLFFAMYRLSKQEIELSQQYQLLNQHTE
ncbi:hypothetical protein ACVFI8_03300 [Agarivorans sp. MS3-6]|uniref:hypothetical protein n=1 Tax=Agarivorans sp. TSD2052 TaxID=2937286 RepID=UPI00200F967E|nr:hypothetical protein [Agarivorans sp. TSD2052]UPW19933.1 hypothetical protein M0C34_06640 [Agarivorans sp. TSD2052]